MAQEKDDPSVEVLIDTASRISNFKKGKKYMDRVSIHKARTVYYGLFASLFAFSFNESHFKAIVRAVDLLCVSPLDEDSGEALREMKSILETSTFRDVKDESDMVLFSPTTSPVPMTASFYDEQRDDGKKRVDMMRLVLQSKFRRNTEVFKENEDHIEFIALFMQQLIEEHVQGDEGAEVVAATVFETVVNPMVNQLSAKIFHHENSVLYRHAAVVLDSFAEFERLFLDVARPAVANVSESTQPAKKLRKEKKAPRELVDRNVDEFVSI